MSTVLVALLLVAAGGGAMWLARELRTPPSGGSPRSEAGSVSVIVPARDEEATLPDLLRSVHGLTVGVREIVVVDDDSSDATAAVARDAGATVLPAGPPPPGWTGKAWACHVGAAAARGDLLLFLDADTRLAPTALDSLLTLHDEHPGLVSVQPFHVAVRAYEQLSAYFNAVAVLASGVFRRRTADRPMAFGPCLLTTRDAYERVGGHAAVRSAILDDAELAAAYHRHRLPVRCAIGGDAIRMRSYPGGVRQWADGWTKNFASGASAAAPVPTLLAVGWVSAHHAVAVGTATALVHGDPDGRLAAWLAAWLLVAAQLRWLLGRLGTFRWWTWLLFPIPLLAFDLVFARSLVRTVVRRSVRWRGREVRTNGRGSTADGA